MTDTALPAVVNPSQPNPVTPGANPSPSPKLPGVGGARRRQQQTSAERKKTKEGEGPKKVVRDFFLLRKNEWVDYSQQEDILNNYYRNYLVGKMQTLMTPSDVVGSYTPHGQSQQVGHDQSIISAADVAHPQTSRNEHQNTSNSGAPTNSQLSAYIAKQKILETNIQAEHHLEVEKIKVDIEKEFLDSTAIQKSGRSTLYSTIINNNETWRNVCQHHFACQGTHDSPRS